MTERSSTIPGLHYSTLAAVVVSFSIVGYPFLAVTTSALDLEGRVYSIIFRAIILGVALILLVSGPHQKFHRTINQLSALMMLTLLVYGLRLISDILIHPDTLGQPISTYLLFFFGVTLVPTTAVLLAKYIDTDLAFRLTFGLSTMATIIGFVVARQTIDAERIGKDRGALEGLNSISLGNLGVTLAILCLWWLIRNWQSRIAKRSLVVALMVTGLALTLFAAARGPVVGLIVVVLALLIGSRGRTRTRLFISMSLIIVISTYYAIVIVGINDLLIFQRILAITSGSDMSSSIRVDLYMGAIEQIMQNPLFGASIEVPNFRFYPHNLFLEYFMATGVLMGFMLLVFLGKTIAIGFRMLKRRNPQSWVFLIFLQSLTGSMFSGALYASNALWISAALTIYVQYRTMKDGASPKEL